MWAISVRGSSMRGSHVDSLRWSPSYRIQKFRVREMVAMLVALKRARPRIFLWCRWLLYYLCYNLLGFGEWTFVCSVFYDYPGYLPLYGLFPRVLSGFCLMENGDRKSLGRMMASNWKALMLDVSITFNNVVILKLYLFKEKERYSARIFESAKVYYYEY